MGLKILEVTLTDLRQRKEDHTWVKELTIVTLGNLKMSLIIKIIELQEGLEMNGNEEVDIETSTKTKVDIETSIMINTKKMISIQ